MPLLGGAELRVRPLRVDHVTLEAVVCLGQLTLRGLEALVRRPLRLKDTVDLVDLVVEEALVHGVSRPGPETP